MPRLSPPSPHRPGSRSGECSTDDEGWRSSTPHSPQSQLSYPDSPLPYPDPIDPSIEFLYKPHTLSGLFVLVLGFVYYAFQDLGDRAVTVGLLTALGVFLLFGVITFRDGPFIRPHPAFWRLVMAAGFAYLLLLTFLLFQNAETARKFLQYYDPSLGKPLPEKSYAENCALTWSNVWNQMDEFVLAHVIGWYLKAIILRDYWFCWILSIMFEVCEYSLQHQLPNFAECWWDHWILDVLVCNWLGTYLGMKTCEHLEMKAYSWRGIRQLPGYRAKVKRAVQQFTPHSWTKFTWGSTRTFSRYVAVLLLLFGVLLTELNAFYLKWVLWLPPKHPVNSARLLLIFFCCIPAVREVYQYLTDPRCKRFGAHAWLAVAIIVTEALICVKYDPQLFLTPFPSHVIRFWSVFAVIVTVYPIWRFLVAPRWRRAAAASLVGSAIKPKVQ